jgi:PIN domain nuclease of toxin-antitoxin system
VKLLLDTHVFLWLISDDRRLEAKHRQAIADPENQVFLSVATLWEATIKYQLGKLPLPQAPEVYLPEQRERHDIASLPIDEPSVVRLGSLPRHHRDPFDRIMVCQALEHGLTIITVDSVISRYAAPIFS